MSMHSPEEPPDSKRALASSEQLSHPQVITPLLAPGETSTQLEPEEMLAGQRSGDIIRLRTGYGAQRAAHPFTTSSPTKETKQSCSSIETPCTRRERERRGLQQENQSSHRHETRHQGYSDHHRSLRSCTSTLTQTRTGARSQEVA